MKFLDRAKIFIRSGDGGNGCIGFRREKYVPFGGPDGGDGGRGGDIVFEGSDSLNTLVDYHFHPTYKAENGKSGSGSQKTGAAGTSCTLRVPLGTEVLDENGALLAEILEESQKVVLLKGGAGGRGNTRFKSSTNQAPRYAEKGREGQERWAVLQLKLLSDAGLVGKPNAGKSTLLRALSAATPKVAAYPFTTLHPYLGVVSLSSDPAADRRFVLADLPGLIEGAHRGQGLGFRFLAHVERCGVLIHVVDGIEADPVAQWRAVRYEMTHYGKILKDKTELLVLNKVDALSPEERTAKKQAWEAAAAAEVLCVSGAAFEGLAALKEAVWKILARNRLQKKQAAGPSLSAATARAPSVRVQE